MSAERASTENGTGASEAGPSRPRTNTSSSAASPETSLSRAGSPAREREHLHLDLATFPTPQLLKLLASLLQQIASSNDQLRADHMDEASGIPTPSDSDAHEPPGSDHASVTSNAAGSAAGSAQSRSSTITHDSPTNELFHDDPPSFDSAAGDRLFTASTGSLSQPSSILSFHARHVPSITIEAYLMRILKYCPTTNEVFLGLLVYFDRMSKLGTPSGVGGLRAAVGPKGFAIDSYNIHRLIIAGVTVASKFFSDVFYTNSRYAKVGGLPAHELNQLELQFLLLNNFTLMIPPEEMQRYGDRLLAYWQAREEEEADEGKRERGEERQGERGERGDEREHENERERVERAERDRERERAEKRGREDSGERGERERSRGAEMDVDPARAERAEVERRPSHQPMEVDPPTRPSVQRQSSSTAPPTPAQTSAQVTRSASLPRRPTDAPSVGNGTPARRDSGRVVAFAAAPVAPVGMRDGVVGVGH